MALLNDILKWTESLPNWQRDACRRLFQKEDGLDAEDYTELYAILKRDNEIKVDGAPVALPLTKEHLPAETAPGEKVTLVALRKLENVNRIPNGHALTFSIDGMTVIYGGNGSGKSGFARVMKKACRARDQSEPIHPNANDPTAARKAPTAEFEVKAAGGAEVIEWSRDATAPDRLSTISVFDSKCARSYITAERDVAYLPYGLDIIENLANIVLPKLSERLEAEIEGIDVDVPLFEDLVGDTQVGRLIRTLSATSEAERISSLGTLAEDETKRLADLEAMLMETEPLAKAEELRRSAKRLKSYSKTFTDAVKWVNTEAVRMGCARFDGHSKCLIGSFTIEHDRSGSWRRQRTAEVGGGTMTS